MWHSRGAKNIRRQYIHHFAWTFVNEKAVFKVDATLAYSQSKMCWQFRALFATVSMLQKRSYCVNMWERMKHGSYTLIQSQIGSQMSGQQQVKAVQSDQRRKKSLKNSHKWRREKSVLLPRQCSNSKTTCIVLQMAATPTLFSRSVPQQLLAVCIPQKNAPGKEIWLQWKSDIRNWGIFWGQRQIEN